MSYTDAIAPRIAYDIDGTQCIVGGLSTLPDSIVPHSDFVGALNSDASFLAGVENEFVIVTDGSYTHPAGFFIALRFPVPKRLAGVAIHSTGYSRITNSGSIHPVVPMMVQASADSTNGVDGTWTTLYTNTNNTPFGVVPVAESDTLGGTGYVTIRGTRGASMWNGNWPRGGDVAQKVGDGITTPGIVPLTGSGLRQVTWVRIVPVSRVYYSSIWRTGGAGVFFKLHLYGETDTLATDLRVAFTDETGTPKESFDWGDVGQNSEFLQEFRITNLSSTLTANSVQVTLEGSKPTMVNSPDGWIEISSDAVVWGNTVSIDSLAPEEVSDTLYLRLRTETGVVGPFGPRIRAVVEEWV